MIELLKTPLFGISLTLITFHLGNIIYNKVKNPLLSPFITSIICILLVLTLFKIPYECYKSGGSVLQIMLVPATCSIAISMYDKLKIIKENLIPMLIGTFVGALSSVVSILILCKIFNLDEVILNSMLPKSVTNAIAIDLANKREAIVPITVFCVLITGIFGAILSPYLIKIFKLKNPVSIGIAMGTSGHGFGTSKAIEMGETQGVLSGIAMGLTGIMTVIILLFI